MEIQINYDYRDKDVEGLLDFQKLIELVLTQEEVPPHCEVALTFVDEGTIHSLNAQYRNIDQPTDVLSFECDGYDDEFDEGLDESIETESAENDAIPFELGDIIISVDRAEHQASEFGLTFAEEVSLLTTHGLLHLCGYDHMEDDEAHEMEAREVELLSQFWDKPFKRSAVV